MRIKTIEELVGRFENALRDGRFSRGERAAVGKQLQEHDLDGSELNLLRSKLFKLARTQVSSASAQDAILWLEKASKMLAPEPGGESTVSSKVFFSPGTDCLHAISKLLKVAKTSVDICVFTITDNRITDVIRQRHRAGVRVRIISDNDKALDPGSDIAQFARAGIDVRTDQTPDHMHHKFAVVDANTVLTGSYNWTRSAAEGNLENLLVTDDAPVVRSFNKEFERLWRTMKRHR